MISPSTTDARRLGYAQHRSLLIMWLCFMIVLAAATSASAQTPITPTTNTVIVFWLRPIKIRPVINTVLLPASSCKERPQAVYGPACASFMGGG